MAELFHRIREAVADGRVAMTLHASDRLEERRVDEWQAIVGLAEGRLLVERPRDRPFPSIEVEQLLPDGTPVKAVWSWIENERLAKLVTVHYFNEQP